MMKGLHLFSVGDTTRPKVDHIVIRLGPTPPTPPSLYGPPTRTCVRILPYWRSN